MSVEEDREGEDPQSQIANRKSQIDEVERLRTELAEKSEELGALIRVSEAIASAGDIEEMIQVVAEVAVAVSGTETCFIYLQDHPGGDLVMRAISGGDPALVGKIRLKSGEGVTGWVAREMKPLVIPEQAWKDARFKSFPELTEDRFESFLSVPIIAKKRTIGVINVRTLRPLDYTPGQIHLLETIAGQVAGAIELARLHHASKSRATQLSAISEVSKTVTSNLYLEEILQLIVAMTAETMNFITICTIMLVDRERGELVIKASTSESPGYRQKPNVKLNESVAGRAVQSGQPLAIKDVRSAPGYQYVDVARQEGLCSLICVPLSFQERIIGVLNCYTSKPHDFTEEEVRLLTTLGQQAAIAIENSKLMVKSAIIQEMHHRIKNNLQTISSLLRLELRANPDNPEEVLRESINRIQSIASVHDLLSREDLDAVSFKKIAESILFGAHQNMISPGKRIDTSISGDDMMLPSEQATSMALILNELIANAVEHGLAEATTGRIEVCLEVREKRGIMEVRNTGTPLPPGFDLSRSPSLGLKIVESLSRESLGGAFALTTEGERTVDRVHFSSDWPVE